MSDKISKGNYGEQLAAEFLAEAGYEILARNFRYKHAEIDIIARKEGLLVFVEVKLRSSKFFGVPEEFVGPEKEEKIREAAEHYMEEKNWQEDIRFDIIAILTKPEIEIAHFQDAFY
jgi:putative endonuclease